MEIFLVLAAVVLVPMLTGYIRGWDDPIPPAFLLDKEKGIIMNHGKNTNNNNNGGIGFIGLLTILFIGLKLMGYIAWSWWWVLSPIWISALLILLISLVVFVLAMKNNP